MHIENENTFLAALRSRLNLFVGSGFSTLAVDHQGNSLPTAKELCAELAKTFDMPATLDLGQIATILNSRNKAGFHSYLHLRFTVADFDKRYRVLDKLPIQAIFTTNIDNLIHEIYKTSPTSYLNDLDLRGSIFSDRNAVNLIALHGCVLDDTRDLTFDVTALSSAFVREPDRWHYLTQALESSPTLFCGYSLADSGTLSSLHGTTDNTGNVSDKWIVVQAGTDHALIQFYKALRFYIIEADVGELLEYLARHSRPATVYRPKSPTHQLFPQWAIPDIGSVPVRPISDYFRGAPPTWYDIYSGRLSTTSHHARVRNALNSQAHTLITGIPGSGKSTLMMQVLKDFPFAGHKLHCDSPTPERAVMILNRLDGADALVGIDNFADDLNGLNVLLRASNVQVLGCGEIYWLEIVSHLLPREHVRVIDVTDLSDADTQTIIDRIPANVRHHNRRDRPSEGDHRPSIFEIVESNVYLATLSSRYKTVLETIETHDVRLLEFLLACAYVHTCRTPISTDMLMAFVRDTEVGHRDFDEMRNRLRGIVMDYVGDLDDGIQDYYSPQSTLIAHAIIRHASARQMRVVISRFHSQVSAYRIHRYDVFRRRAFDHELMQRVFDEWEEGMKFYRGCYEKEANPYVLQQGALYLSAKSRYQEAFQMIDQALSASSRILPSIRKSHAAILFKANIDRPDTDGIVKTALHKSMEILKECYDYDQRKAYHAQVFSDQALRYDRRFGREEALGYLQTALAWLSEEKRRSPWHREVARLHWVVERRLGLFPVHR